MGAMPAADRAGASSSGGRAAGGGTPGAVPRAYPGAVPGAYRGGDGRAAMRPPSPPSQTRPIRVLVVDDSVVIRRLVSEALAVDRAIDVVGVAANGRIALSKVADLQPDVIILDIDMPEMNGVELARALRAAHTDTSIIVFATASEGGDGSVEALDAGADEYVAKPANSASIVASQQMVLAEIVPKIKALAARRGILPGRRRHPDVRPAPSITPGRPGISGRPTAAPTHPERGGAPAVGRAGGPGPNLTDGRRGGSGAAGTVTPGPVSPALVEVLHQYGVDLTPQAAPPRARPRTKAYSVLLIGASTGGPDALAAVVQCLPGNLPVPVLIVQHMPPRFTLQLANRLDRLTPLEVSEAGQDDVVRRGRVLLAPGGMHLELVRQRASLIVRLTTAPKENFCRPAVDVLFRTAVAACGDGVIAAVLTGMGRDGEKGARLIRSIGGTVIAQDEATSVVWGMPGAVVQSGLADDVVPLERIGSDLTQRIMRVTH